MTKYLLITEADTNDADYVHGVTVIKKDTIPFIKKIAKALKSCKHSHNWDQEGYDEDIAEMYKGILTEDDIDNFSGYLGSGSEPIHSVKSIEVYEFTKKTILL